MSTRRTLRLGVCRYSNSCFGVTLLVFGRTGFSPWGEGFEDNDDDAKLLIDGFDVIAGEAGRLIKEFIVIVIGVLDGLGPGSMESEGNDFKRGSSTSSTPGSNDSELVG